MAHSAARHGMQMPNGRGNVVFMRGWSGFHGDGGLVPIGFRKRLQEYEADANKIAAQVNAEGDSAAFKRARAALR